jgi:AraC-like DNA-binding protein
MLQLAGDTGLGLEIGLDTELGHLGPLGYAAVSCNSLAEGIESVWGVYRGAFGVMAELRMPRVRTAAMMLEIHAPWQAEAAFRFSVEEALTFFFKIGGWVTGVEPKVLGLRFAYAAPAYSARYDEIFRCPITFGAARSCAIIDADWLNHPLKTSDNELNSLCRRRLQETFSQISAQETIATQVRDTLLRRQDRTFSIEAVAASLDLTPRTLERRLRQQGHTYRDIVEGVRLSFAREWLVNERMAPREVSRRLGFSDAGTFRRAFKGWTGLTVGEFVSSQAAGAAREGAAC